ncbi:MAG: redoxin domain-containing protein [bacterium]|nr:redoxin domain-containing protein [bacterium]
MSLIFIAGIALLYLVSTQFFKQAPVAEEITFGIIKETAATGTVAVQKTGYLAPSFELANLAGEKVKLSDYKGKIIVLTFWTAWNPSAKDQLAILELYYQEIKNKGDIIILTINSQEDKSAVLNLIGRGEYGLPVLLDEDGKTGELYSISILPATYFISRDGKVKEIYIGVLNREEIKNKAEKLSPI